MIANAIQQCARCDGHIPRENHTVVAHDDYESHWLLCDFCEILDYWEEHVGNELFAMKYVARTEPDSFRDEVTKMENARAA